MVFALSKCVLVGEICDAHDTNDTPRRIFSTIELLDQCVGSGLTDEAADIIQKYPLPTDASEEEYQEYYDHYRQKSVEYSTRIAKVRTNLKAIEESEHGRLKELPPLKPMEEALDEYMTTTDTKPLVDGFQVIDLIGGPHSQYYRACYTLARVMLVGVT